MTPEQFRDCIATLGRSPADFVVRALAHAADALQQTPYADGGRLIVDELVRIQKPTKPRLNFGPPTRASIAAAKSGTGDGGPL